MNKQVHKPVKHSRKKWLIRPSETEERICQFPCFLGLPTSSKCKSTWVVGVMEADLYFSGLLDSLDLLWEGVHSCPPELLRFLWSSPRIVATFTSSSCFFSAAWCSVRRLVSWAITSSWRRPSSIMMGSLWPSFSLRFFLSSSPRVRNNKMLINENVSLKQSQPSIYLFFLVNGHQSMQGNTLLLS